MPIVVVTGRSLFVEGITTRLREHLQPGELIVVDAREPDAFAQIVAASPSTVVMDITDSHTARLCLPGNLPLALPGLKLIYLDPEQGQVQIVTSEQRLATHVRDLIDVIGLG